MLELSGMAVGIIIGQMKYEKKITKDSAYNFILEGSWILITIAITIINIENCITSEF